jgi:microcystin degradation protein MlrC
VPPTVTLLTAAGPYAEMVALGQHRRTPEILNVSVMGGFAYADTAKNGIAVIVTARRDAAAAHALAREVAELGWTNRDRFRARLTALEDAVAQAAAAGKDRTKPALCLADVADNPGGGGRGNTCWILKAFHDAGVEGALLGIFYDPALAAEAHALGAGAKFRARFNRDEAHPLSGRFEADAVVEALHDGHIVGRRGISAGHTLVLGPMALVRVGGIRVAVVSVRQQAKDIAMFEAFGLDVSKARCVIVKSRGHFRAAFDEIFPDDRIIEVDVPGLTTPVLQRVPYRDVPRPVFPLDTDFHWAP